MMTGKALETTWISYTEKDRMADQVDFIACETKETALMAAFQWLQQLTPAYEAALGLNPDDSITQITDDWRDDHFVVSRTSTTHGHRSGDDRGLQSASAD